MTIHRLANLNKKRFNFRFTTSHFTFFAMLAKSQKLEGITSQVFDDNGKPTKNHYIFFDLEGASFSEIINTLRKVQTRYRLSNIYITSDNNKTFRAWCFSVVTFGTYLKILIDCENIVDYGFLFYTFKRKEGTLRLSRKEGRPFQNVVAVLESSNVPFVPFPSKIMRHVIYVTGCEKQGSTLNLGVD